MSADLSGVKKEEIKRGDPERKRQRQLSSLPGAPLKQRNGNVCSPPPFACLLKDLEEAASS